MIIGKEDTAIIWKLWTGKKNKILGLVQELLLPINQQLTFLNHQVTNSLEQNVELGDQIRKLGRLQYKSGQDVQGKLEGINTGLEAIQQWQVANSVDKSQLDILEQQIGQVCEILLIWLDDLDLLATSLREQDQDGWLKLLETWMSQVLQALKIHGIEEMQLVGTCFNQTLAESIGTVVKQHIGRDAMEGETAHFFLPYEIAEVVKRGFIYRDGTVLRKAQVIAYQEDDHE